MFASAFRALAASLELPIRATVDLTPGEIQCYDAELAGADDDDAIRTIAGRRMMLHLCNALGS